MRLRWWLVTVFLLLLAGSHASRWLASFELGPDRAGRLPLEPGIEVTLVRGDDGAPVRIAYQRWPEWPAPGRPTLLLLHGSPGSRRDFAALAPLLADRFELIAPDLPGFGASERSVPDYSIRAHAAYVERLLRKLGRRRVHVLGFSMGGGVALELARQAPESVASITLVSSIGAQEFELLGSYHLNRAIHAAQLVGLTLLHEAIPHFGALDGFMLNREYARNFLDTDQRPLRRVLQELTVPTLIIHGERDPLVSLAAAREHHRLVPQSELALVDSDHFIIFREPERIAEPLAEFVDRVERGAAVTRARATAEKVAAASRPFDPGTLPRATGLTALVWFALLALATLVSEDLTCISAGLLVAQGRIGLGVAVLACGVGIFLGDLALFAVGRVLGRPWLRRRPLRWFLSEARIDAASDWFRRRGPIVILLSRFTPGMRLPTYLAAGLLRTSLLRFTVYFGLAVALWTPILVAVSAALGAPAVAWIATLPKVASLALPLAVVALWLLIGLARSLITHRGRRLWVGRLRRWRHYEFWPIWLFYVPVAGWIVWLGLKHRSLTLFTAANPAIPDGGFVGESKLRILEALPADAVARFAALPAGLPVAARSGLAYRFMVENRLEFPVVLKPEVGERGRDVVIASDREEIERYLSLTAEGALIQEFVPGLELGVFYVRQPGQSSGQIFSITDKRLISVTGDGDSTLEELILNDERAVAMAPLFLRRHRARLHERPDDGQEVRLVDVGTHCRGALFLDGARFATPELTAEVDRISRGFDGFYFGRYDLRAPTEEALRAGRDLKVLELNGVTSEATHVYDPAFGLANAYRVLFEQWRLAFEIGAANRERGASPTPPGALIARARDWIRASGSERHTAGATAPGPAQRGDETE